MCSVSTFNPAGAELFTRSPHRLLTLSPPLFPKFPSRPQTLAPPRRQRRPPLRSKFSSSSSSAELSTAEKVRLKKLPDKKKPLYSHSLHCIEAWLKGLGFYQGREDRAVWLVEKLDWHAQLSLDVADLFIRYLKTGPGNIEKDVERRFSYALSREDIENAILSGP